MKVERIAWLGTRTQHADAMARFLRDTLGLTPDHQSSDEFVFGLSGGGKVEVFGPGSSQNEHFTTGPVAGFLVEDVAAAAEELREAGIEILLGPAFDGGLGWVHFRAPDGNVYELTQGPDLVAEAG